MFKFLSFGTIKGPSFGRSKAKNRDPGSGLEPLDSAEKLHFVPGLRRNDEEKLENRVIASLGRVIINL
jgi:hypothetical protein